ncbi:MAG TPA: lysylphosphatidylglycerol synthase domain-containing protein [Phycisphaerae bacterium]|nr:lysylphosphatidylglycerol synthase domain-containing protein [Phycisphaerae bacterium]
MANEVNNHPPGTSWRIVRLAMGPNWRRVRIVVGVLLVALVLYFVGRVLFVRLQQISWAQVHVRPLPVLLAIACFCLHRILHGATLGALLRSFGSTIGYFDSIVIARTASLGRYIPGKLFSASSALLLLARFGVRIPTGLASVFFSSSLTILVGFMISAPLMLMPAVQRVMPSPGLWCAVLVLLGLVTLHPRVFLMICNRLLRRLGRQPITAKPALKPFVSATLLVFLRCALLGFGVWLSVAALMPLGLHLYPLMTSTAVLASVVGFLAFFAPSGIGVREGIYILILGPTLGATEAALAAVFLRLIDVLTDIVTGVTAILLLGSRLERIAAVRPSEAQTNELPAGAVRSGADPL